MSESKRAELRYKTTNWKAYNAALKARGSLTMWLDRDIQWSAPASGKRGRQQTFSDRAIEFCLSMKCLFGLALRQTLGLVQSLLRLAGLNWRVPDFSTVNRRQRHLQVQLPYRPGTSALELLVDSTGIQFLGEGECKRKKHGPEYRRQWRKVHLGIDAQTLNQHSTSIVVTVVEHQCLIHQIDHGRQERMRLVVPGADLVGINVVARTSSTHGAGGRTASMGLGPAVAGLAPLATSMPASPVQGLGGM